MVGSCHRKISGETPWLSGSVPIQDRREIVIVIIPTTRDINNVVNCGSSQAISRQRKVAGLHLSPLKGDASGVRGNLGHNVGCLCFKIQSINCFTGAFKELKYFSCAWVVHDYLSRGGIARTRLVVVTSSNEKDLLCLDCLRMMPFFNPFLNFSSVLRILFSPSLQWLSPAGHCRSGKIHMHVDVVVLVMVSMGSQ